MEFEEIDPSSIEFENINAADWKQKYLAASADLKMLQKLHEDLQMKHDKYFKILRHLASEHNGLYFICGEVGVRDDQGLPDGILVCPSYGLDGFCLYKKDGEYSAPEW